MAQRGLIISRVLLAQIVTEGQLWPQARVAVGVPAGAVLVGVERTAGQDVLLHYDSEFFTVGQEPLVMRLEVPAPQILQMGQAPEPPEPVPEPMPEPEPAPEPKEPAPTPAGVA